MKDSEFIKEHKRLVKVLASGSKVEQMNEAKKQDKELKEFLSSKGKSSVKQKQLAVKGLI